MTTDIKIQIGCEPESEYCKGCRFMKFFNGSLFCTFPEKTALLHPKQNQDGYWDSLWFYRCQACKQAEKEAQQMVSHKDILGTFNVRTQEEENKAMNEFLSQTGNREERKKALKL